MSVREQIKTLEIQREETKAELFELYAEQADQKLRWTLHQESTPFEDRLELEADIRDLEAERQHSKVKLMKLKQQLRLKGEQTYRQIVEEVLTLCYEADMMLEEINKRYEQQLKENV